jgi:hypothetical protein
VALLTVWRTHQKFSCGNLHHAEWKFNVQNFVIEMVCGFAFMDCGGGHTEGRRKDNSGFLKVI